MLLAQDPAQPFDVGAVELSIARRRSFGIEEALALEEADLGNGQVGELRLEQREDFADGQEPAVGHRHLTLARTGHEDQLELADLHFVATVQRRLIGSLTVDVGAVE